MMAVVFLELLEEWLLSMLVADAGGLRGDEFKSVWVMCEARALALAQAS